MPTTTTTTERYNAKLKFEDWLPKRRDGLCRCGCGERLTTGQRVWIRGHDVAKVREFQILKGNGTVIRAAVFERDKGVCAACKMDTEKARRTVLAHNRFDYRGTPEANAARRREFMELCAHYRQQGFPSPSNSWWQADHIVEVVRGGGGCGLDNFQTLCVPCHKTKTKRLARDRANERRGVAGTPMLAL